MASAGTIIGQIQTSTQPTGMQVSASPSQVQQLQPGTPQTITISTPQQVPLPPTVPPVKMETQSENTDGVTQGTASMVTETAKDNTGDGKYTKDAKLHKIGWNLTSHCVDR